MCNKMEHVCIIQDVMEKIHILAKQIKLVAVYLKGDDGSRALFVLVGSQDGQQLREVGLDRPEISLIGRAAYCDGGVTQQPRGQSSPVPLSADVGTRPDDQLKAHLVHVTDKARQVPATSEHKLTSDLRREVT